MAWISLAKMLLFVFGLVYLIADHFNKRIDSAFEKLWSPRIILGILCVFSFSLLWSVGDMDIALLALVKHSKLLEILLLISLIRTPREARLAMTTFAAGQALLLLSSWLMAAGVPIPWSTSADYKYVVFSTYLDQSIIFATTAAVVWHLRSDYLCPRWLAALLAAAALINVFLLLEGRTGYAVALTVLSLAVMWSMPERFRLAALIATPTIVIFSLYLGSTQVQDRLSKIIHESQNYANQGGLESSSGWRLNAWHRSIQATKESPWLGHGVGSWTMTIKQLEGSAATEIFGEGRASNPHQEYLLWGVELGLGGTLLLISLMVCVVRDALRFKTTISRAIISVVAAMATACMFNSTLYDALIGDYFCIALGLLIALGIRTMPTSSDQTTPTPDFENLKTKAAS
jgi:O-antigen ligase